MVRSHHQQPWQLGQLCGRSQWPPWWTHRSHLSPRTQPRQEVTFQPVLPRQGASDDLKVFPLGRSGWWQSGHCAAPTCRHIESRRCWVLGNGIIRWGCWICNLSIVFHFFVRFQGATLSFKLRHNSVSSNCKSLFCHFSQLLIAMTNWIIPDEQ